MNMKNENVSWIVRILLIIFVAAIPFESINLQGSDKGSTISRIFGIMLFISYALMKKYYNKIPKAFIYFIIYYFLMILRVLFTDIIDPDSQYVYLLTFAQLIIMFFIVYDLFKHEQLRRDFISAFGLSCGLLAILTFFGYASSSIETAQGDRLTALNESINKFGQLMSFGTLMLVSIWLNRKKYHKFIFIGSLVSAPFCLWSLINTGSRGSLLGLAAGVLVWFVFSSFVFAKDRRMLIKQIAIILIVVIGVIGLYKYSDIAQERWDLTFETHDTATRGEIFQNAFNMFLEKPLYGWGSITLERELGSRLGEQRKDTHNILLWVILESGLLGGIPWILGVWGCIGSAISAARKRYDLVPIMLITTVIISGMSSNNIQKKILWLVLAFALSSAVVIKDKQKFGVE